MDVFVVAHGPEDAWARRCCRLQGDFTFAEPRALLGFAGPTVIKNTIRAELPEGFQRSEFLLEHGFLDRVVSRIDQKETITKILEHCRVGVRA